MFAPRTKLSSIVVETRGLPVWGTVSYRMGDPGSTVGTHHRCVRVRTFVPLFRVSPVLVTGFGETLSRVKSRSDTQEGIKSRDTTLCGDGTKPRHDTSPVHGAKVYRDPSPRKAQVLTFPVKEEVGSAG